MHHKIAFTEVPPRQVKAELSEVMRVDDRYDLVLDLASTGCHLTDAKTGENYFDFVGFFGSLPLGMNHPDLLQKLAAHYPPHELLRLVANKPSNSDFVTKELANAVRTMKRTGFIPDGFKHLFFVSGGALANENALKAAMDWKVRKNIASGVNAKDTVDTQLKGTRILHFKKAFHGRSGYTMSLTKTDPMKVWGFAKHDWPAIDPPVLRFPLNRRRLKSAAVDESESIDQICNALEKYPDDIAALIIEPLQAEGGDNHFRPQFLRQLRALADARDFLLIFDEVQTGMGRSGRMWAWQHFDVAPDIFSFCKMAQVGGVLSTARIDEVPENVFALHGRINSTFGGDLIDIVRLNYILQVMQENQIITNAATVGAYIKSRLEDLMVLYPQYISNIRGRGMMLAFDLPSVSLRNRFKKLAYQNHLLVLSCGEKSIRFRPMLCMTKEEADEGLEWVAKTLEDLAAR